MAVRILFFGAVAEIVGKGELYLPSEDTTVAVIRDRLIDDYPRLAGQKLLFAVDQKHATPDNPVDRVAEVAIFTAVSGG